MNVRICQLDVYRTAIPMRSFEHAAARRDLAEGIVVRMGFSDGRCGWGEALPRPYVTGETLEGVAADLIERFWPAWAGRELPTGPAAASFGLPAQAGRCVNAASCAADLAGMRRLTDDRTGAAGEALVAAAGQAAPRRAIAARVSGVLGSGDPGKTARRLRLMRWFGLREFKLKLGLGEAADRENLRIVHGALAKALAAGKCSLRVDVNGGWDAATTPRRVEELAAFGVGVVEQPVFCQAAELAELAAKCRLPLMADESLRTEQDARALLAGPAKVWWNIRLSKNGGLLASLTLARLAAANGVSFTLGCMVGETSILSAAQRLMLQWCPPPRFVEGNYGRFLLAGDLVRRPLRFGYAGRLRPVGAGWIESHVDGRKLQRYGTLLAGLRA